LLLKGAPELSDMPIKMAKKIAHEFVVKNHLKF
jgi:hypothetical protein